MNAISLQKLYDDLSYGELSQVHLSSPDSEFDYGEWDEVAKKKIISHLNLALTAIYTKFPLKEKEVVIQLYPHITQYFLDRKYARTNTESTEVYKYIVDSEAYPFTNDILRIERCYDEGGVSIPINDMYADISVFIPDYTSIQVPFAEAEFMLFLLYRASHPVIQYGIDEKVPSIEVPTYLYEALLFYITYRVHKTRSNDKSQAEALRYLQQFEAKCLEVEQRNLTNNAINNTDTLLDYNGWV